MTLWAVHHHPQTLVPVGVWTDVGSDEGGFGYAVAYSDQYQSMAEVAQLVMAQRGAGVQWGEWVAALTYMTQPKAVWSSWVAPSSASPLDVINAVIDSHDASMQQKRKLAIEGL
jgi:ribosomal protein S5